MGTWKEFKKRQKEQEQSKKKNKPYKNYRFLTDEYKALQRKRFDRLLKASSESAEERKLYKKFLEVVHQSFKTDNKHKKFSLRFVEALGIDYDILFIYTKKDVGKTWAAAAYITKLLQEQPEAKIAFIRNSKEEAKGFIEMMNGSENWPVYAEKSGDFVYKKEQRQAKKNKRRSKEIEPCGIFAYCSGSGFTRWQGGNWDNLRFWYWDECNSVQGGLTHSVFQQLNVFLSSLVRDKTGEKRVKGLMTGNLLEKSNIFLERLGVSSKTRLKLFKVHKDNDPRKEVLSTMLYLNTGDLFQGIEDQKGLATQFLDESELENLLTNRPGLSDTKAIYEELDLKSMIPQTAFVFRDESSDAVTSRRLITDYILYTYRIRSHEPGALPRMVIGIDPFKNTQIKPGFSSIFCHNPIIANRYPMTIPVEEADDFGERFIDPIKEYLNAGEVGFGGNGTQEIFDRVGPILESRYAEDENESKSR